MIDWHTKTQFPLLSWSAQAEAFFAHRFKPEDADNPELKEYTEVYFNDLNWRRMKVCDAIAAKHGVKRFRFPSLMFSMHHSQCSLQLVRKRNGCLRNRLKQLSFNSRPRKCRNCGKEH